ncbi:hypothetical protein RRG08_049010 [Elysia crispata]|uniref:Uncharacterized protein n=1 Tax=Elysia crispata TaxID=231223 RepID=A0AAE0XR46_9GAST|nr:hypothetical protein RRG08_049010 [Elysia crispata]
MFMKYPSSKQHICLTNNENRKRKTIKIPIEIGKHLAVMDGFEFGSLSNSFPVVLDACYSARGLPQVATAIDRAAHQRFLLGHGPVLVLPWGEQTLPTAPHRTASSPALGCGLYLQNPIVHLCCALFTNTHNVSLRAVSTRHDSAPTARYLEYVFTIICCRQTMKIDQMRIP